MRILFQMNWENSHPKKQVVGWATPQPHSHNPSPYIEPFGDKPFYLLMVAYYLILLSSKKNTPSIEQCCFR
jgi:hypothetical protein